MGHQANPRGEEAVRIVVAFTVVGNIVVLCRLYIRVFMVRTPGWEDVAITLGMFCSTAFTVLVKVQEKGGLGMHVWDLTEEELLQPLRALYASIICYYSVFSFVKASFIFQYLRIFQRTRMRRIIYMLSILIGLFSLETIIFTIFLCVPVEKFWEPNKPGFCFDKMLLWFTNSAIHILTDIVILLIPIVELRHLNLPKPQKRTILILFALGFFACATSIVRLHTLVQVSKGTDLTYDNAVTATWSAGELNIGLICASVPALQPLLVRIAPRLLIGSSGPQSEGQIELSRPSWRRVTSTRRVFNGDRTCEGRETDQESRMTSEDQLPLQGKCWAESHYSHGDGGLDLVNGVIKVSTRIVREVNSVSDLDTGRGRQDHI